MSRELRPKSETNVNNSRILIRQMKLERWISISKGKNKTPIYEKTNFIQGETNIKLGIDIEINSKGDFPFIENVNGRPSGGLWLFVIAFIRCKEKNILIRALFCGRMIWWWLFLLFQSSMKNWLLHIRNIACCMFCLDFVFYFIFFPSTFVILIKKKRITLEITMMSSDLKLK